MTGTDDVPETGSRRTGRPFPPTQSFLACPDAPRSEIAIAVRDYREHAEAYMDELERQLDAERAKVQGLVRASWEAVGHMEQLRDQVQQAQLEADMALENGQLQGQQEVISKVMAAWHPALNAVYDDWAEQFMAWYDPDAKNPTKPNFQAARDSFPGTQVLIGHVPPGKQADPDNMSRIVCGVAFQSPRDTYAMREAFKAAEAFAVLLSALPDLFFLHEDLQEMYVGRPGMPERVLRSGATIALPPAKLALSGEEESDDP